MTSTAECLTQALRPLTADPTEGPLCPRQCSKLISPKSPSGSQCPHQRAQLSWSIKVCYRHFYHRQKKTLLSELEATDLPRMLRG